MTGALAAVDVQDFAGHEAGRFEIEDRIDDVGHFAHVADRVQRAECRVGLGADASAILMMPGETAFTRMPRLAYSIASDWWRR